MTLDPIEEEEEVTKPGATSLFTNPSSPLEMILFSHTHFPVLGVSYAHKGTVLGSLMLPSPSSFSMETVS
jgi:hypothetical protein